jgi:ABC-type multidrug transport system fused ATPase/permease subunit
MKALFYGRIVPMRSEQKKNKKVDFSKGLRIVWKYLRVYKRDVIILSIAGVFSAVGAGVIPYFVGRFFDGIITLTTFFANTDFAMNSWAFFIILWIMTYLIENIIEWRTSLKRNWLGEQLFSDYIINGFGRLLALPISFHKSNKMGEITNRIDRSASSLLSIVSEIIIRLMPQFLGILVGLTIAFLINTTLASVMLGGILFYIIVLVRSVPPLSYLQRQMQKSYSKAYGEAYDAVFNVQALKQVTSEKHERKKIFTHFKLKAGKFYVRMINLQASLSFYQRVVILLTQVCVFLLSVSFINSGSMTIGELVMFNTYSAMLFTPFIILAQNWKRFQNGLIALGRSEKALSVASETYEPKNAIELDDIKGEIEFENVSFAYKKGEKVLDDISLKVRSGEVVALVGESGGGKSTLIDLISAYYFANKGIVLVDGHDVKKFKLNFLRSKIAVVPQEVVLFNDAIKTNIKYGNFKATDKEVEAAAKKAHCSDFIEKFPKKWKQVVGERGIKLSVGQKQRVAIARAILRDPKILILDEPTSALDAKSEKIIQASLEELMKGRTTFIIAHRLSTVRKADKILVIKDGKIAEEGRHDDLIKIQDGVYRELYEHQKL